MQEIVRQRFHIGRAARSEVKRLDVFTEDFAGRLGAFVQFDVHRVIFDLGRDGADDSQAGVVMEAGVADDQRGAVSALLMACLGIEIHHDNIALLGNISDHQSITSRPTSAPVSNSTG